MCLRGSRPVWDDPLLTVVACMLLENIQCMGVIATGAGSASSQTLEGGLGVLQEEISRAYTNGASPDHYQ